MADDDSATVSLDHLSESADENTPPPIKCEVVADENTSPPSKRIKVTSNNSANKLELEDCFEVLSNADAWEILSEKFEFWMPGCFSCTSRRIKSEMVMFMSFSSRATNESTSRSLD